MGSGHRGVSQFKGEDFPWIVRPPIELPLQQRKDGSGQPDPLPDDSWKWCRLVRGGSLFGLLPARIQMIPVDDGVESQGIGSLRLPTPEGSQSKHDDVPLTERLIEGERTIGERLAACEFTGEQNFVCLRGKLAGQLWARPIHPPLLRIAVLPDGRPRHRCFVSAVLWAR